MGKLNISCPHTDDCGVFIGEYPDDVYQMPTYCPYCGKRILPLFDSPDSAIAGTKNENVETEA